jgi:hypothetical protein
MHAVVQATSDALRATIADLAPGDLARRRRPDSWSVAQILDHLRRTYAGTAYILNRCLEQNVPKGRTRPTLKERVSAWVVVDRGHFPTGIEAPPPVRPSADPAPTVATDVLLALAEMDAAVEAAERRFGTRIRLANHAILGPFDARQWRQFHHVHTLHHLPQISRLLKASAADSGSRRRQK